MGFDGVEGVATFVKIVYEKRGDLDKVFAVGVLSPVTNCCTKDEAFETWYWEAGGMGEGVEKEVHQLLVCLEGDLTCRLTSVCDIHEVDATPRSSDLVFRFPVGGPM